MEAVSAKGTIAMTNPEFLVVGSGLTGACIARILTDAGRKVVVVERRGHLGGNVHDHLREGIRVHTYGPHYFRTSSTKIWDFVTRFAHFRPFEAEVRTRVDGRLEQWPVTRHYLEGLEDKTLFQGSATNFEEATLKVMPREAYERFVKGYTQKQWGVRPCELEAALAGRFAVRDSGDVRLKSCTYQGLPSGGYHAFMRRLLEGIELHLDFDFLRNRSEFEVSCKTVFTGPIDEYYDFSLGRLAYRAQRREHTYLAQLDQFQPVVQVNEPDLTVPYARTLEWKHMEPDPGTLQGTVITRETPFTPSRPNDYEYPFPALKYRRLYEQYREKANQESKLLVCGRLGDYRYYDMDQAIARAIKLAQELLLK